MANRRKEVKFIFFGQDRVNTHTCMILYIVNGSPAPEPYDSCISDSFRKELEVDGNPYEAEMVPGLL